MAGFGLGPGGKAPIVWTPFEGTIALAPPASFPGSFADADAMNPDGSIIVGNYMTSTAFRAFMWTVEGGLIDLPDPVGSTWDVCSVSDDGSVVAGSKFPPIPASVGLIWSASEGFVELGILSNGVPAGYPLAMTPDARVIAGGSSLSPRVGSPTSANAYFWTKRRGPLLLQPYLLKLGLPVTGWTLTAVTGISDDGMTICGKGIDPSGKIRAWRAELPYSLLGEACPCIADFDESGGMPTTADLEQYFQAWIDGSEGSDTDCSGGTPEFGDLNQYLIQWLTGGC